jgi:hypothetical protein
MQGLNGEVVLNAKDITVGYVPASEYYSQNARRSLRVTVTVGMEALTRQDEYETTDHRKVTRPLDFSITTAVWNWNGTDWVAGGATVEPLRHLVKLAPGFTQSDIDGLLELSKHHLSGMRPGCVHQQDVMVPEDVPQHERAHWMLDNAPACPETGYKWGHAWLLETLPEWLTADYVRGLLHLA